jgi:hypothetical protein
VIRAWSRAKNIEVGDAFAEIKVMNGDLNGYTGSAYASDDYVTVSQKINKIDHAEHMETRTWAGSR